MNAHSPDMLTVMVMVLAVVTVLVMVNVTSLLFLQPCWPPPRVEEDSSCPRARSPPYDRYRFPLLQLLQGSGLQILPRREGRMVTMTHLIGPIPRLHPGTPLLGSAP